MRVLMQMKWPSATVEQYESLRKNVNWEGDIPPGAVCHFSGFSTDALYVSDVWESEADMNAFLQHRLMPEVKKMGIPGQPEIIVIPLHALFTPGLK